MHALMVNAFQQFLDRFTTALVMLFENNCTPFYILHFCLMLLVCLFTCVSLDVGEEKSALSVVVFGK